MLSAERILLRVVATFLIWGWTTGAFDGAPCERVVVGLATSMRAARARTRVLTATLRAIRWGVVRDPEEVGRTATSAGTGMPGIPSHACEVSCRVRARRCSASRPPRRSFHFTPSARDD